MEGVSLIHNRSRFQGGFTWTTFSWLLQRMAVGHQDLFFTPALLHLQASLSKQSVHARSVDHIAGLAQLQIDHPRSICAMALCQGHDYLLERTVAVLGRLATVGAGNNANDAQAKTFAQPMTDHVAHQFTPGRCAHHYYPKASSVTSYSSMASASNHLCRPFSVSNSLTSICRQTRSCPKLPTPQVIVG